MKDKISELQEIVQAEKKNLTEKVSAELDTTLKQAVKEKEEMKQQLEDAKTDKEKLQNDYDDMLENYNTLKQNQKSKEELNEQSAKIIADLEEENRYLKKEKEQLTKTNLDTNQKIEAAYKGHEDIKSAF